MSLLDQPDRACIEASQLASVNALLAELTSNPFYACKLHDLAGVTSLEAFRTRVPFTSKQELVDDQRAHPPFGTNLTYPLTGYTRFSQTSGTADAPLRWLDTNESWSWMVDNWLAVFRACGVGPGDRIFYAFSFGPFLGFWTSFEAGARLGCLCLPGGGLNSAARLRMILDHEVTVLCCTPTYAIRLGEVAREEDVDLASGTVRTIMVAGEPGGSIPATRERIEGLWPGARVHDHHGMTEVGPVSFECPQRRGVLHVMESRFIAEVIDPTTDQHVERGEQGELVLTNLGRMGSPLIRYRTGDLVKRAITEHCECGRYDLALDGGILGRVDDMVVVRGVNLHPSAVEAVVRNFVQVAEYRVEINTGSAITEVNLQLEAVPDCSNANALASAVESALRAAFNLRIPVTPVASGTLPRFELKAKRWVRTNG